MLLANYGIDDSQSIPVLSSVATAYSKEIADNADNNAFASDINYDQVSTTLRQCDKVRSSHNNQWPNSQNTLDVRTANTNIGSFRNRSDERKRRAHLNPEQWADL